MNSNDHSLSRWNPSVGSETLKLLDHLKTEVPDNETERIRDEAIRILARSSPPQTQDANTTGLVVGYVQSGKTMSFTTVSALARDNGYRIVIVVTGISVPLLEQSTKRLEKDLQLASRQIRRWQLFTNPAISSRDQLAIKNVLDEWSDKEVPDAERRTVLITVMKHHGHLQNLIDLLQSLRLQDVPVLIVDDEADQASLNNRVRKGEQSTVYQKLSELRHSVPHHTFLQYTATPQAPLLINIIDILSPDFAEVLTPGEGYTGGREFFLAQPNLVREIPNSDIATKRNRLAQPPESLKSAMRLFFLGVAAGLVMERGVGNRSMLVHPSQKTIGHRQYFHWVTNIKQTWNGILEADETDHARLALLLEFEESYRDLQNTVANLASFQQLSVHLLRAFRNTIVEEVNATRGKTPHIDWSKSYGFLLVGGQAMDRGFTIEGLTVTYMPRSLGVANADTVQQRARFFGYKAKYAGYCRIFLEKAVIQAYRSYVTHEEDVRERLVEHSHTTKPLSEWKRKFFLTSQLRPTRANVLDLDYMHEKFSDRWFEPQAPHDSMDAVETNREIIQQFIAQVAWQEDKGHKKRREEQKHYVGTVRLNKVYEDLLVNFRYTRAKDSQEFTGILLQIERYLQNHPDADCTIYHMKKGGARRRTVNERDEVETLFQGAYPDEGTERGQIYPGDRRIRSADGLTIQIHNLEIRKGPPTNRETIANNIPLVAVFVPSEMAEAWIVQPQDG